MYIEQHICNFDVNRPSDAVIAEQLAESILKPGPKTIIARSFDEFIAFGNMFSSGIETFAAGERAAVVSATGPARAGRALLALVMDRALHPARYPTGLITGHYYNNFLRLDVFKDTRTVLGYINHPDQGIDNRLFRREMNDFMRGSPGMRLYFAVNIIGDGSTAEVTFPEAGDKIDLAFHIKRGTGDFVREITIGQLSSRMTRALVKLLPSLAGSLARPVENPALAPAYQD